MPTSASVSDVARNFSAFIDRVERGERFVLTRGGKAVAELRPVAPVRRLSELPAIFAALPRLGMADPEAFGQEIDAARAELGPAPLDDRWDP
jgi:prevent-host-death family protein